MLDTYNLHLPIFKNGRLWLTYKTFNSSAIRICLTKLVKVQIIEFTAAIKNSKVRSNLKWNDVFDTYKYYSFLVLQHPHLMLRFLSLLGWFLKNPQIIWATHPAEDTAFIFGLVSAEGTVTKTVKRDHWVQETRPPGSGTSGRVGSIHSWKCRRRRCWGWIASS